MKYINKLNINFDEWEELNKLNNECIYLLFRNTEKYYLGYFFKKNEYYYLKLVYSKNYQKRNHLLFIKPTYPISSIFDLTLGELGDNLYISYLEKSYKDIKKLNLNIIIVGIDKSRKDILNNVDKYLNNKESDCIKNL